MFSSNTSAVSADAVFVEEVFQTHLYTGNGSTQTITNGIDLSTKGGLIWTKSRSDGTQHQWCDTARGINKFLRSEVTNGQYTSSSNTLTSFNSNGYTMGADSTGNINYTGINYASWTFRKQPKFFDVVTYTGTGSVQNIAHNLGSVPGCIIVKSMTDAVNWNVYHRSVGSGSRLILNTTDPALSAATTWNNTDPTATQFTVGTSSQINFSGSQYVAYLFAHDAGGFGLTGTDNVISCGSFTPSSGEASVTLGYEPQWILWKDTQNTASWQLYDTMRGLPTGGDGDARLFPNNSNAEQVSNFGNLCDVTPTGFNVFQQTSGNTYIYIAIRRGPMKTPTTGTSVFSAQTGTYSAGDSLSVGFPADMYIDAWRTGALYRANYSRLVNFANSNSSASQNYLKTNTGDAEVTTSQAPSLYNLWNTTARVGSWNQGVSEVWWMFRRAPGFFDVVCYTGNGTAGTAISHNLGVVPELVITKKRSAAASWYSLYQPSMRVILLNNSNGYLDASLTKFYFGNNSADVSPTASTFTVASDADINQSGATYVAYLFASVAGVSKVGSYTGTGALQTINCGFTGGARFVLIKRTDSAGSWYVYDSARGISSGNDPYLLLNGTAAEVTNTNYVDTTSVGFQVTAAAPADLNANGGTYIFLAIA